MLNSPTLKQAIRTNRARRQEEQTTLRIGYALLTLSGIVFVAPLFITMSTAMFLGMSLFASPALVVVAMLFVAYRER